MRILYAGPNVPEYLKRLDVLISAGHQIDVVPRLDGVEADRLSAAEALLVLGAVSAEVISAARRLRLIQVLGAGVDGIDLAAARRASIPVATTDGSNATSVAEHAMALMLALVRRLAATDRRIRGGEWPQLELYRGGVMELAGKTLGLVGCGHIGQRLARMAQGFDLRTLYYQRRRLPPEREAELRVSYAPLDVLLAESDIVSIQVPLTAQTRGLIGREALARMKRNALLINVSRGEVVDEAALIDALERGALAGAGLDVFASEPLPTDSRLRQLDQVLLSPHVAGAAQEAVQRTFDAALENLARLQSGHPLLNVVKDA